MPRLLRRLMVTAMGLGGLVLPGPIAPCALEQPVELDWMMIGTPLVPRDLENGSENIVYVLESDSLYTFDPESSSLRGVSENPGSEHLKALTADSLLAASGAVIYRSTDGGQSWPVVFTKGGELFASALDGPNRGALLTGIRDSTGLGYSHDRGATWHRADGLETSTTNHECGAFAELRAGPHTGRLVAGCLGGMVYSDDRGATWGLSNLWADFVYRGASLITAQDGVLYARIEDPEPGFGLWASADGATWTRVGIVPTSAHLVGVGGGSAPAGVFYAVGRLTGEVHRSFDVGQTWEALGRVYDGPESVRINAVIVGPDGRLYAALTGTGTPDPHWGVYRTTGQVVPVGSEPAEAPGEAEATLRVWPNPAFRVLHVATSAGEAVLYDVLGREALHLRLGGRVGGVIEADVSGLAPGVYVVRTGGEAAVVTVQR